MKGNISFYSIQCIVTAIVSRSQNFMLFPAQKKESMKHPIPNLFHLYLYTMILFFQRANKCSSAQLNVDNVSCGMWEDRQATNDYMCLWVKES